MSIEWRHAQLLAAADPGWRQILKLHQPYRRGRVENCCQGCEDATGDESCIPFPCRTYVLAERIITGRDK